MIGRRWRAPLAWAAVILTGTSIPGPDLPHVPGRTDLLVHGTLYGVLGFLLARARGPARPLALAALVAAGSLFGALDELHQRYIPGRTCAADDWIMDTLGVALGVTLYVATARQRRESTP